MAADERTQMLWNNIVRQIKAKGDVNQPLWRALDAAIPVTLDGTEIVIGFEVLSQADGRALELPGNQAVVDRVLSTVATKPLTLTVIDGTTIEEYEDFKARRAAAAELARAAREHAATAIAREQDSVGPFVTPMHRDASAAMRLLNELQRTLHQQYIEAQGHGQTLGKAQFLLSVLPQLLAADTELEVLEPNQDQRFRQWSRALERVAEIADANPVMFTVLYLNFKARQES